MGLSSASPRASVRYRAGHALQWNEGNGIPPQRHREVQSPMPKYVIEREIPGAGKLSAQELKAISQKSCSVLSDLGPQVQWQHSYVTDDKIYCVYIAPNEKFIREHAEKGGFPANRISEVKTIIDPVTSE
jgi:hypothetical protein